MMLRIRRAPQALVNLSVASQLRRLKLAHLVEEKIAGAE